MPFSMKYLFFLIITGVAIASCNSAAESSSKNLEALLKDSSKFTSIQWQDTAIDFGAKKMGEVVNITFTCKNIGDKPLYLITVRPSCGCTVADYTKEPIAPGKEGKIDAQFDTKKSHPGDVRKTIFITANNSNRAPQFLAFTGTILADSSANK